jgi:hypothetical protein
VWFERGDRTALRLPPGEMARRRLIKRTQTVGADQRI